MILLKGAKLLTMADDNRNEGDILIDGDKIVQVGGNICRDGAEIVDCTGLVATPGIVDPHCHIGMWEDGIDEEGADGNEMTAPITPELRAIDAINPMDRCFKEALDGGVTTVVTGPGSANVISGQFAAIKTGGNCVDDMIIKAPCALKVALGENPKGVYGEKKETPSTRMATAALLREALIEAQNYLAEQEEDDKKAKKRDFKNEIVAEAVSGKLPVKVHAHRADDILTAIRIAKEFDLTISLDHCTEGYLIADKIKESGARVILGPLMCDRCKPELKNLTFTAPAKLYEAGVEFGMMSDHPVQLTQYLPIAAALAVKNGLPAEEALKSITIFAARAAFVDDRVGSLEPGKDADIVLWNGNPLEIATRVKMVYLMGEKVRQY